MSSYTLFFLFELLSLSWISVEDHIASSALVSSLDHRCAVLGSDILQSTKKNKNYLVKVATFYFIKDSYLQERPL